MAVDGWHSFALNGVRLSTMKAEYAAKNKLPGTDSKAKSSTARAVSRKKVKPKAVDVAVAKPQPSMKKERLNKRRNPTVSVTSESASDSQCHSNSTNKKKHGDVQVANSGGVSVAAGLSEWERVPSRKKLKLVSVTEDVADSHSDDAVRTDYSVRRLRERKIQVNYHGQEDSDHPLTLLECEQFRFGSQPYYLVVDACVNAIMDVHAHLSEAEIIGLLGGDIHHEKGGMPLKQCVF
jgi:hypothetical protein